MNDYDIVVLFNDQSQEIIPVTALSPARAFATATYRMDDWTYNKQERIVSLTLSPPHRRTAAILPLPRPQLLRRKLN